MLKRNSRHGVSGLLQYEILSAIMTQPNLNAYKGALAMAIIYQTKRKTNAKRQMQVQITALDHLGQGIARHQEQIIFVPQALPQETVQVQLTDSKKSYAKARLTKVLTPSAFRQAPPCEHFTDCGGCQLQHASSAQQLLWKQQAVDHLLQHQLQLTELPWQPAIESPATGYRRKARLGVWYQQSRRQFQIGFRQQGDFRIQPLQDCLVLSPVIRPVFSKVTPVLKQLQQGRSITHLELIDADGKAYVIVRHTQTLPDEDIKRLIECWPDACWIGEADSGQFTPWQAGDIVLGYRLADQQLTLEFAPDDFIQINADVNQTMVNTALDWLDIQPGDRVLDLYCGIGNFSLPLAQKAAQVVGVEGVSKMVQRAATNAKLNGLSNADFVQADLHLPWPATGWSQTAYQKVLLDPARAGAEGSVEQLGQLGAERVLYVSCNPESLARDAVKLMAQGYRLTRLNAIEMFPYTRHLEVMALFCLQSKTKQTKPA
ncbi:MAG: 23S rRNA (uracil(1939)-C(5))-methyltransferase RlmD [Alkalimonas sp.]|nr:23S rRNA (uracil(1939)-C(5))-methyltransferase RlmD [Alkalimonas sp.]